MNAPRRCGTAFAALSLLVLLVIGLLPQPGRCDTALSTALGCPGSRIRITGGGFGAKKGSVRVGTTSAAIVSWTSASISITLPRVAPGDYDVVVRRSGLPAIRLTSAIEIVAPLIESTMPTVARTGDSVTVTGTHFGTARGRVVCGGRPARVVRWGMDPRTGASSATFVVPQRLEAESSEIAILAAKRAGVGHAVLKVVSAKAPPRWRNIFEQPSGIAPVGFKVASVYFPKRVVAHDGDVYVGGLFTSVGGRSMRGIARWDGAHWHPLGSGATNGVGGARGFRGDVQSMAVAPNGDLYVAGNFVTAGGVKAKNIARWDGVRWRAVGAGISGATQAAVRVSALAFDDAGNLYVGGIFAKAGNIPVNNLAKWNGSKWSALGLGKNNGTNGVVLSILCVGQETFVGGNFTRVAGVIPVRCFARWYDGGWSREVGFQGARVEFRNSANDNANDAAVTDIERHPTTLGKIVVAGNFKYVISLNDQDEPTNALCVRGVVEVGPQGVGGASVSRNLGNLPNCGSYGRAGSVLPTTSGTLVGSYQVYQRTDSLTTGDVKGEVVLTGHIYDVAQDAAGKCYATGATGQTAYAGGILAFQGASGFPTMTAGHLMGGTFDERVSALAASDDGHLLVGGWFRRINGTFGSGHAVWDGNRWTSTGVASSETGPSPQYAAGACVDADGGLVLATHAGGVYLIPPGGGARVSIGTASKTGGGHYLYGVAARGRTVVLVGIFDAVTGPKGKRTGFAGIGEYHIDAQDWRPLAATVTGGSVTDAAAGADGELYVGGIFTAIDGVAAKSIARLDGSTWTALGKGTDGFVRALAVDPGTGDVYAGGSFAQAGGKFVNYVARWNGSAWSALGTGIFLEPALPEVNPVVNALAFRSGKLYAGGRFNLAGSASVHNLAVWNGSRWSPLRSAGAEGVDADFGTAEVLALTTDSRGLYVGGHFHKAGAGKANFLAFWNF